MKKRRWFALACAVLSLTVLLAACSSGADGSSSANASGSAAGSNVSGEDTANANNDTSGEGASDDGTVNDDGTTDDGSTDNDASDSGTSDDGTSAESGTAPDLPDGDTSGDMGEPPTGDAPDGMGEPPTGDAPDGMGEPPEGDAPDGMGEPPEGDAPGGMGEPPEGGFDGTAPTGGMPGGTSSGVDSYDAVTQYTEDTSVTGESFTSTGTDENAVLVSDGATVSLKDISLTRESSDSTGGDISSFYGVGAGLLATDGTVYIDGGTFATDAAGGTGVFAYGDGIVYIKEADITSEQGTSGGIHVAGGGRLFAWDLNVETQGASSAAIRSDRGGGTMVIDGGSYVSNGSGSPAIYCTADIAANDAALTANGSEAICIEGLNSISLFDCDLTGNMPDDEVQNDTTWTVIVYQSMSGDAEVGNSTFRMVGGTLASENGGLFYTTNTECHILLSGVDITPSDESEFFLRCTGNENARGWGAVGSNGSQCTFTAADQSMTGDVLWDSVSTLDFYMTDGSVLTGAVLNDESCAGDGGSGYCSLYIGPDSTWVVTGESALTNLYCAGTIVGADGSAVTVLGTDGTVYVQGDGTYTVTVDTYSVSADLSGADSVPQWSDYAVELPAELQ